MSSLVALSAPPYKGLAPFEDSELDALLFFGREREREVIVANLLASKLTVLYGPSGVGKSSILRAGVARRLREVAPEADVVVFDEWAGEATLPPVGDEAFLILDQFEEYFLYHGAGPLLDALPDLLARPRVHVLIALREDGLAALDAFQTRIPNVFANRLRLGHLDRAAARAAILGPLDRWNAGAAPDDHVGIESALVAAVLEQVAAAPAVDGDNGHGSRIEAPYLQLVMERVWEEERAEGSPVLRESTLERLGGARTIVSDHLARALEALPPAEAAIATHALRFLVTPSRTKIAHSFGDLVGYTDESPVELRAVLERLASQRILRAVAADGGADGRRYEIFHDVLAEPVLAWRREFEGRTALAREREAAARRHRRLTIVAIGAGCIAAAMIAITAYALTQRGEAGRQRRVAQQQADLALGQKTIAQRQAHLAELQRLRADRQRHIALDQRAAAKRAAQTAKASESRARHSEARAKQSETFALHEQRIAEQQAGRAGAAAAAARRNASAARRNAATAHRNSLAARRAARSAKVGELTATAAAKLGVDPVQSIRAALAASALERSPRVEDALRSGLIVRHVRGIFDGGGGAMNAAVFSPDGTLVATASNGGGVRLFRAATHQLVNAFKVGAATSLVFSSDGRQLLAGTRNKRALVWDTGTGRLLHTLPTGGSVLVAVFAGGDKNIVTGGGDQTLRIWDAATGDLVRSIPQQRDIRSVAVSADGALVAVVEPGDAVARVFSVPDGTLVASVPQQAEVTAAAFSPSGAFLVTAGRRNGYVWNTQTWHLEHLLVGHDAALTDVVFALDGRVVTTSVDSSARVWNPATGELIFVLAAQHQQKILAAAVSPDGTKIATASADRTARIWPAPLGSTPTILAGHTAGLRAASFSRDGKLLLTASDDGTARLWDPSVPALAPLGSQAGAVDTVSYSADGKLVLSAGADATARLWRTDETTSQVLRHAARINTASFVSGGREVLTASDDGTAKLWRVSDGGTIATYSHGAPVRVALLAADGVVTAGADGSVKLWTRGGKLVWSAVHGSPITAAAVSEGTIATGASDGTIRIWRERDGAPVHTLTGHTGAIDALAFSPDGTQLASGGADSTARLWTSRGTLAHTLTGHTFDVTSVSFSPDGRLVLTSSVDGDARLWSAATGHVFHRLSFHVATVSQAAFSLDGRWVVTAGPTTAGLWQVSSGKLVYSLGGTNGQLLAAAFAPDSRHFVVGTSTGNVAAFDCTICARTPALLVQARAALRQLRPAR
jgi:WD40 repeat protein